MSCNDKIKRVYGDQIPDAQSILPTDKLILIKGRNYTVITMQDLADYIGTGGGGGLLFVSHNDTNTIKLTGKGTITEPLKADFIGSFPSYNLQTVMNNGNFANKALLLTVGNYSTQSEGLNFQYTHDKINTGNEGIIVCGNLDTNTFKPLTVRSGLTNIISNGTMTIGSNDSLFTLTGIGVTISPTSGEIILQTAGGSNIRLKNTTVIETILQVGITLTGSNVVGDFNGRVKGQDAVNSNEFITKQQLDSKPSTNIYNSDGSIPTDRSVSIALDQVLTFQGTRTISGGRIAENTFKFNTIIDPINIQTSTSSGVDTVTSQMRMQPDLFRIGQFNNGTISTSIGSEIILGAAIAQITAETPSGTTSRDILQFIVDAALHQFKFQKGASDIRAILFEDGRFQGADALNNNEFVTLSQLNSRPSTNIYNSDGTINEIRSVVVTALNTLNFGGEGTLFINFGDTTRGYQSIQFYDSGFLTLKNQTSANDGYSRTDYLNKRIDIMASDSSSGIEHKMQIIIENNWITITNETANINNRIFPDGRIKGTAAQNSDEFIIKQQLDLLAFPLQKVTTAGATTSNGIKITNTDNSAEMLAGDAGLILLASPSPGTLSAGIYVLDPNGVITNTNLSLVAKNILTSGADTINFISSSKWNGGGKEIYLLSSSGGTGVGKIKIGFGTESSLNGGFIQMAENAGILIGTGNNGVGQATQTMFYMAQNTRGFELTTAKDGHIGVYNGLKITNNTSVTGTPLAVLHVGSNNGTSFPSNNPVGYFEGRVRGVDAINNDEFITLSQLNTTAGAVFTNSYFDI